MAKTPPEAPSRTGLLARVFGKSQVVKFEPGAAVDVDRSGWSLSEATTTASLSGDGINLARTRQLIYQKWQQMMAAPLVSGALRNQATAALGGDQATAKQIFIQSTTEAKLDPKADAFVATLAKELEPMFNGIAFKMAYLGAGFGDAYARVYTKPRVGILHLRVDEMLFPPLCIPFEQGGITRAVQVAVSPKYMQRLEMNQVARLKMPRMIYTPQPLAQEMAMRVDLSMDDVDNLPLMPSLVGGSFLADAEEAYDNFRAALSGLVGQRLMDSVDETMILANVMGLTAEQRQSFTASVVKMFQKSKAVVAEAVKLGKPVLERIRHIIPIYSEKQLMNIQSVNGAAGSGGGRAGSTSIEDVMFHAKLLGGALGTDISMLGFADLIAGGLGEGGFFRTSAQSAERSRLIRTALTELFNDLIDVHLWARDGKTFDSGSRPWAINFFGSISALEAETTRTKMEKANTTLIMLQCYQIAKDSGLDEAGLADLFENELGLDADKAKANARSIMKSKKDAEAREAQQAGGFGGGGGGPFGGGGGGDDDPPPDKSDDDEPLPGAPQPVGGKAK